MNRTLSMNATPEQYNIIKRIAEHNNITISSLLKEAVQTFIGLSYVNDMLTKMKFEKVTDEAIKRNSDIMMHAEEMTKLMQPYYEKAFSAIPSDVIKALEDEGKEMTNTMKAYNKPLKHGRPPKYLSKSKEGS